MTDRRDGTTIGLHPAVTAGVCAAGFALGAGLGIGSDALLAWFEGTFDSAPAPVRVAAALPTGVAAAVLAAAGLLVGLWFAGRWKEETLVCTLDPEGVRTRLHKRSGWVPRSAVAQVFVDGEELVLADRRGRPLAVGAVAGVGVRRLGRAFTSAGYPWSGTGHPRESAFRVFVEGRDDPGAPVTDLLTQRAAALAAGDDARARALRLELGEAGAFVRDRHGEQEYVLLDAVDR